MRTWRFGCWRRGIFPSTIRDFRALHLKEFSELFVQVVRLAREMGLVKLGTVAIDGPRSRPSITPASMPGGCRIPRPWP